MFCLSWNILQANLQNFFQSTISLLELIAGITCTWLDSCYLQNRVVVQQNMRSTNQKLGLNWNKLCHFASNLFCHCFHWRGVPSLTRFHCFYCIFIAFSLFTRCRKIIIDGFVAFVREIWKTTKVTIIESYFWPVFVHA